MYLSTGQSRLAGDAVTFRVPAGSWRIDVPAFTPTWTGGGAEQLAGVVTTIKARCKRCYTCVRTCPAKAIKVEDGQAHVIEDRCIACGLCYKVCAQQAIEIQRSMDKVHALLQGDVPVIACLDPSFPAVFPQLSPGQLISAVRALGFDEVLEVAFGAELVAREYTQLFQRSSGLVISTPCPAVTSYVQKYVPSLVPYLAPVVSPAIALGRVIKQKYCPEAQTVFIGPCIAMKAEIADPNVAGAIDLGLTFSGLKRMLRRAGVRVEEQPESCPDGPLPGRARIFPVPGGLLSAAGLEADILDNDVVVAEGMAKSIGVLQALEKGELHARFVHVLFCQGCIDGPTMEGEYSLFARKEAVANYVRARCDQRPVSELNATLAAFADVDLSRRFTLPPIEPSHPTEEQIAEILERIGKRQRAEQLNCGACGYRTCREKAIAVSEGLAEVEMCLPYLIEQLENNLRQLERYQHELQETQDQLVHSEKLASMGQLAAGIAHELNNPLGTILIYSHLLLRDMDESSPERDDLELIVEETKRCKSIVAGLLDFARQRKVLAQVTDVNALLEDTLGRAAKQPLFSRVQIAQRLDRSLPRILADPHQLREVFWNLIVNAAQAMPHGGTLTVTSGTSADGQRVVLEFADTGVGISEAGLKRLFTPFYTTKPKGTGLGLAIAYGIIKMHRGNIEVSSREGVGTTFTLTLPINREDLEPQRQVGEDETGRALQAPTHG